MQFDLAEESVVAGSQSGTLKIWDIEAGKSMCKVAVILMVAVLVNFRQVAACDFQHLLTELKSETSFPRF